MNRTDAGSFKHTWLISLLWTNIAVVLVDLIAIRVGPATTTRSVLHMLAFTFVYANLTSVLALLVLGWLFERPKIRRLPEWAVIVAGILFFTAFGCVLAQGILTMTGVEPARAFWPDYFGTLRFALPLALVFGLGAMTHASLLARVRAMEQAVHEKEIAEERSRKLAAEVRLRSLESWIHPHFLFNTLNSISALIAIDPKQAEQTVGRLAALLRASLDNSDCSLIPLRQEIDMIESYIDIERTRLGPRLRGSVEVPPELREAKVPPMSVQSLVENAVKHGIVPQPGGGEFLVSASAGSDGSLHIAVRDSGSGFDLASIRAGHGLDKLVQRLDALFGDRARLNVSRQGSGQGVYSLVEMVLPRV
jgi:two-component system, LytTR family, sensor histidine kinase AlgZ